MFVPFYAKSTMSGPLNIAPCLLESRWDIDVLPLLLSVPKRIEGFQNDLKSNFTIPAVYINTISRIF
jgi:hypothetical protein